MVNDIDNRQGTLNIDHLQTVQNQIRVLQQEVDELRERYQCSLHNVHTMEMERDVMQREIDSLRDHIVEERQRNAELQSVIVDLQNKHSEHLLNYEPAVSHLEHSQKTTHLESQLAEEQEYAKQLSSQLSYSMEENQRYREALEHNDVTLRRKQESSKNALNALHQQIDHLQSENDELKKELVRYELDRIRMEEVNIDYSHSSGSINHRYPSSIPSPLEDSKHVQIVVIPEDHDHHDDDRRSETGDSMMSSASKRSIVMTIHDLASIVRKSETVDETHICSQCLESFMNPPPDRQSETSLSDEDEGGDSPSVEREDTVSVDVETWNELLDEQKSLRRKLKQREKKIDHLTDAIAVMKMQREKKATWYMPWCG